MRHLFLIFSFVFFATSFAQQQGKKVNLYLKLYDFENQLVSDVRVKLTNMQNNESQYFVSDKKGNINFVGISGQSYKVFILDTVLLQTIDIPKTSQSFLTKKISIPTFYSAQLAHSPLADTIDQRVGNIENLQGGQVPFRINLYNSAGQPLENIAINLFHKKSKMVYLSETNEAGEALLHVPENSTYYVGINQFANYDTVSTSHSAFNLNIMYVPTQVAESAQNDTIFQTTNSTQQPTSDRALVKLSLLDQMENSLPNEWVYFDQDGSNTVYAAQTESNGLLEILLPNGKTYTVNFTYERDVQRINFPLDRNLYTAHIEIGYIGTININNFFDSVTFRNGFQTTFLEPKVKPTPLDSGTLKTTNDGFTLDFANEEVILTPAIYDGKLFVSSGYYGRKIYCFDAVSGKYIWGTELAENGPSVMVVEDGVLLVNTQSCTLYAIDIESGKRLWSKWLGPNIYHSPTVANGVVYTTYPNLYSSANPQHVLVAFELKTGALKWQSWIQQEPLGAPVFADNKLFISGNRLGVFCYKADSGELVTKNMIFATGIPVYYDNTLWISAKQSEEANRTTIINYDTENLKKIKELNLTRMDCMISNSHMRNHQLMSTSNNRIVFNSGTGYIYADKGIVAFKPDNQTTKWTYSLDKSAGLETGLVVAGDYIVGQIAQDKIGIIGLKKGNLVKSYSVDSPSSEPAVDGGWIYYGTKNGQLVAINAGLSKLNAWNQWGMNGAHNASKE